MKFEKHFSNIEAETLSNISNWPNLMGLYNSVVFDSSRKDDDDWDDVVAFSKGKKKSKKKKKEPKLLDTTPQTCSICLCEDPAHKLLKLKCKHYYHKDCLLGWVKQSPGKGDKFVTATARCPTCRKFITCKDGDINSCVKPLKDSYKLIFKILTINPAAGLNKEEKKMVKKESKKSEPDELEFMKDYIFYFCFDCGDLFFGGMKNCEQQNEDEEHSVKKDRICVRCAKMDGVKDYEKECKTHGTTFIAFKCRYCCDVANWFCHGTTHYCDPCHKLYPNMKVKECPGLPACNGRHAKNGEEQCLGCVICRGK